MLSSSPTTVDQWCAERIDAIKATVDGKGEGLPELRRVMEVLDSAKVADEIAVISNIRKEYWKTRERQRKAVMELRRAEREVQRIGLPASQIESKINRLSRYARFIESGWQDGQLLDVSEGLDEKDGNAHVKQEPPHTKKEESLVKQEPPPATDCQIEDDVKEGR